TVDQETQTTVIVECSDQLQLSSDLPWWFKFVPSQMQALTKYPFIYHRDPLAKFTLEGFLHEYQGHWFDQRNYVEKYPTDLWTVRYLWRWVWSGFSYHGAVDERTCNVLAKRMRDKWLDRGCPMMYTAGMQMEDTNA
ncbi:hypothetical protein UFOVP1598_1, partial [uncultured Caudovirales phage]